MGIYRCPASGGDAIALAQDTDGVSPQEFFDRKTVYFASRFSKPMLRKCLCRHCVRSRWIASREPRRPWALSPGGIYFVRADAPRSLRYFDFATRQLRPIFDSDKYFGSGLSVSPDGRWIIYSQIADANSDIMLVDHFQ
jgi:hypothetical protein